MKNKQPLQLKIKNPNWFMLALLLIFFSLDTAQSQDWIIELLALIAIAFGITILSATKFVEESK